MLQHSSQISTPLLTEAQRGSGALQSAQTSLFRSRFDISLVEMPTSQTRQLDSLADVVHSQNGIARSVIQYFQSSWVECPAYC